MISSDDIITAARGWIGTPYRHQASLKNVGCDCLGLVRGVWRDCFGSEPEATPAYAADWAESDSTETLAAAAQRHMANVPLADFRAGDLLLFRWKNYLPAKHAGIATANNKMIHAQDGSVVSEVSLSPWWMQRLAFVFRFPDQD